MVSLQECRQCGFMKDGMCLLYESEPETCIFRTGFFRGLDTEHVLEEGPKEETTPETTQDITKFIGDSYLQLQKIRIAIGNRLAALRKRVGGLSVGVDLLTKFYNTLLELEGYCVRYATEFLQNHPAWPWLSKVRGVGPTLAMRLLSMLDIRRADTISDFWRYCGLGVVDGKAERTKKGEKRHYNVKAKATMFLIAISILRSKGKFAEIYYREKERQKSLHPELKPIVIHLRALRKMEKVFLGCLWLVWREALGLPTRPPYAHEYLGHTTLYNPWHFTEE